MAAEAFAVGSVTEVAEIMTVSAVSGAVKTVAPRLRVWGELKFAELQGAAPAVVQLHFTPLLSFVVTAIVTFAPSAINVGGPGASNVTLTTTGADWPLPPPQAELARDQSRTKKMGRVWRLIGPIVRISPPRIGLVAQPKPGILPISDSRCNGLYMLYV
jgi:hypothetical protein